MEYIIELNINYNDSTVDFDDYDVVEIIGDYDTENKNEVIEKFNNLVYNLENKDDVLLNKLNDYDSPWRGVYEIDSIEVFLSEVTDEDNHIIIEKFIEI